MTKVGFCSDIHLDHLTGPKGTDKFNNFVGGINALELDALLIAGDISNGLRIKTDLANLDMSIQEKTKIYFVLGNHDYWNSGIKRVKKDISNFYFKHTYFLSNEEVIELASNVALVGDCGFYSGSSGKFFTSNFWNFGGMPEFSCVDELKFLPTKELQYKAIQDIVKESIDKLIPKARKALEKYDNVYVMNHVPQFEEASMHGSQRSDDNGIPFFCAKEVGEELIKLANEFPHRKIIALAGHSHTKAYHNPLPNLECFVTCAEYKEPTIYKIFNF